MFNKQRHLQTEKLFRNYDEVAATLTFHPEVSGAFDTVPAHDVAGALASVVGVVKYPVQPAARPPLVDVKDQGGVDRAKVSGGKVGRKFVFDDSVALVVGGQGGAVLEPHHVAHRVAFHLAVNGEVAHFAHGTRVRWQTFNERGGG